MTIDGTPRLIRLLYDSGFAGATGTDMAGHIAARNLSRFTNKINVYLNYTSGTQGNGLRIADALDPLNMYALAVGNAFLGNTVEAMSSSNGTFDVVFNPSYSGVPFRTGFAAKPRAAGVYLSDEVTDNGTMRDNVILWNGNYRAAMPSLLTLSVFLQAGVYQALSFMPFNVGELVGFDPYPIGAASELNPGSPSLPAVSTYGYMNFEVAEAAALARYHALLTGKTPITILQLFKFGSASRYITDSELWSHMVATAAEGSSHGWWSIGNGAGALNEAGFDGTERTRMLDQLDTMTTTLASLESIMLTPSNPALLTGNSTTTGNALTWRLNLCNTLRDQGGDRPCWLFSEAVRFQDEFTRLSLTTPDTSLSNHMLDQSGNVRTRCWESGGFGLVAAYNLHPDPQANVAHQWHTTATRCEVIGENRDVALTGGGRTWTDTYGGSSSLRQGTFNQGHLYRLTLGAGPAVFNLLSTTGTYGVSGTAAMLSHTIGFGPVLIAFTVKR